MLTPSILSAEEIKKYNPRPKSSIVKLSSNENPYGPSERVLNAIKNSFSDACRYPYEFIHELQKTLASKHGVPVESIVVTGGSNEALRVTGLAISSQGGNIVAGKPTYLALMSYAEGWGSKIKWVSVDSEKGYDLKNIKSSVDDETKMIFIANPNNPTGTYLTKNELLDLRRRLNKNILLVVDDAYFEYMKNKDYKSGIELFKNSKNVFILRTFSKIYGLASLRIGWGYGDKSIIKELYKIKPPFNVNKFAQICAVESLKDDKFVKKSVIHNLKWCKKIKNEMLKYNIGTNKISGNFFLLDFKKAKFTADTTLKKLQKYGIILREMNSYGIKNCLRLTIGNTKENQIFLKRMNTIFKNV